MRHPNDQDHFALVEDDDDDFGMDIEYHFGFDG